MVAWVVECGPTSHRAVKVSGPQVGLLKAIRATACRVVTFQTCMHTLINCTAE